MRETKREGREGGPGARGNERERTRESEKQRTERRGEGDKKRRIERSDRKNYRYYFCTATHNTTIHNTIYT